LSVAVTYDLSVVEGIASVAVRWLIPNIFRFCAVVPELGTLGAKRTPPKFPTWMTPL
jgi:hypothetical protein